MDTTAENKMGDILRASLDGIRDITNTNTFLGKAIETASGVTVIPVSKITIAFATGGVDYGNRRTSNTQSFGGGGGSGINVNPIGFLTVGPDASVQLISVDPHAAANATKEVIDFLSHAPEWVTKIKDSFK